MDEQRLELERNLYERAYRVLLRAVASIGYSNPPLEEYLRNNGIEPSVVVTKENEFKYLRTLDVEVAELAIAKSNEILSQLNANGNG